MYVNSNRNRRALIYAIQIFLGSFQSNTPPIKLRCVYLTMKLNSKPSGNRLKSARKVSIQPFYEK
jgi:hypothetical protein